jgi:methyl-accepting chemotaxis protein
MHLRRYSLLGALVGLALPVAATLVQWLVSFQHLGFVGGVAAAQSMPLLWIIDSSPVWAGLLAGLAGRRKDQLESLEKGRGEAFARTARDLVAAARTLLATVASFSTTASETAAAVRETTATMGQLGHTATQAALTAETVIGLADSAQRRSEEGLQAVDTATGEMLRLGGAVHALARQIEALNGKMRDIFEIASVVNQIAERSQRLADTAQGEMDESPAARGFQPVVAELRRQSEDAKKAAGQVKGILGEVHGAMLAAMTAAESGARSAEQGAAVARSTGETIRGLATALQDSSKAAREIATVAQQQDRGIDQVLAALNEIYLATQETMASTQRVAREAKVLDDLAAVLRRSAPG